MTEKQEQILQSALELFATEGYHATSTNKVARTAKVSEGLIFKHFQNKEGLLTAVLNLGKQRSLNLFSEILETNNPKERIIKALSLPFQVPQADYKFWHLQYKLKWELNHNDPEKMQPLINSLTQAFTTLNTPQPELEAELVLLQMEGIIASLLKGALHHKTDIQALIIQKFNNAYPTTEQNSKTQ